MLCHTILHETVLRHVVLVRAAASDCGCWLMCRPLPAVVMPCLGAPLATILGHLNSVFPPAAACLAAQGASNGPTGGLAPAGTPDLMWDDDEEEDQGTVGHWAHACKRASVHRMTVS